MGPMASQITSLRIVYSTVYSDADQRKHPSSASLAFVRGIHRWPVNSPHKWPVTRKMFPFDDVIMRQTETLLLLPVLLGHFPRLLLPLLLVKLPLFHRLLTRKPFFERLSSFPFGKYQHIYICISIWQHQKWCQQHILSNLYYKPHLSRQ